MDNLEELKERCRIAAIAKMQAFIDTMNKCNECLIMAGASDAEVEEFIEGMIQTEMALFEDMIQRAGV